MCGLAGVALIGRTDPDPRVREFLDRAISTLAHRGPDAAETEVRGPVGFAFTRLSLVDLEGGSQPLHDPSQSIMLIANGEIYNHEDLRREFDGYAFRTKSDCEVLIPLYKRYGLNFLDEVHGVFALALYDARSHTLVLATDGFTAKPMYFYSSGSEVVFGSEIKALFDWPSTPRAVDWERCLEDQALSARPVMDTSRVNTWFRGVEKVEGGTMVSFDILSGQRSTHRYWTLGEGLTGPGEWESEANLTEAYSNELERAVSESLMADVEIGMFLSGGLDSAAIAAIAIAHGQPLHTFTVATPGTIACGDVSGAQRTAKALGVENSVAVLSQGSFATAEDWKRLLWLVESPQTGPGQFYKYQLYQIAKEVRPGIKAMLLGSGADEFNGGYSSMLAMGGGWADFWNNISYLAAPWIHAAADQLPWSSPVSDYLNEVPRGRGPVGDIYERYTAWKYRDVQQYNCWTEDRVASGNGIEARVPYLDRGLVDLSVAIPERFRSSALWNKSIARHATRRWLPSEIRYREKKPFYDGSAARFAYRSVRSMLRADGYRLIEEAMSTGDARTYLNAQSLRAAVDGGNENDSGSNPEIVLRLVNIGLLDAMVRSTQPAHTDNSIRLYAHRASPAEGVSMLELFGLTDESVPRMAKSTSLELASDGETWQLEAPDGERYDVVDPLLLDFLRIIDGVRTMRELRSLAGIDVADTVDKLEDSLLAALEAGAVVLS